MNAGSIMVKLNWMFREFDCKLLESCKLLLLPMRCLPLHQSFPKLKVHELLTQVLGGGKKVFYVQKHLEALGFLVFK